MSTGAFFLAILLIDRLRAEPTDDLGLRLLSLRCLVADRVRESYLRLHHVVISLLDWALFANLFSDCRLARWPFDWLGLGLKRLSILDWDLIANERYQLIILSGLLRGLFVYFEQFREIWDLILAVSLFDFAQTRHILHHCRVKWNLPFFIRKDVSDELSRTNLLCALGCCKKLLNFIFAVLRLGRCHHDIFSLNRDWVFVWVSLTILGSQRLMKDEVKDWVLLRKTLPRFAWVNRKLFICWLLAQRLAKPWANNERGVAAWVHVLGCNDLR